MWSVEFKINKLRKQNILWLLLFLMGLWLMIWKLPYGFGGDDEGFYLTAAHRLTLGQRLFTDEWHLSQLSSFFLYPFVKLFKAVTGGTDGILLASRRLYLVCHSLTAAVVYIRLRKFGTLSVVASVMFMLFTPFDMMTCSYNTIALDMLALTAAFAAPLSGKYSLAVSGVFFACAVVCCPYLALAYVLYALVCIVYTALYAKTGREFFNYPLFTLKSFALFTAGIALVFIVFLLFLFSHTSVSEIIAALPGLFSDPEHPSYSVFFMLGHYVWCIFTSHKLCFIPIGIYILSLVLLVFDAKRQLHPVFHIALPVCACLLWLALMCTELTVKYYNGIMLPLSFLGFNAYILTEKKARGLFASCFVLGIIYSLCVNSTSNMGFDILVIAFSVVNIASLVFIGLFIAGQSGRVKKSLIVLCAVPVLMLCAMSVYAKQNHCFWDGAPKDLCSEISVGPAKGIVTNEYFRKGYEDIYNDMQEFSGTNGKILVYSQQSWEYLISDLPYASFSAWLSGLGETAVERLELYYGMNGENLPELIYIPKSSAFGELNIPSEKIYSDAGKHGFTVDESGIGYILYKES